MLGCMQFPQIESPDDAQFDRLAKELTARADALDASGLWPGEQLRLCGESGVFRWFLPQAWGGFAWSDRDVIRGYLGLSAACLTTTFIITQRTGACRRILASENEALKGRLLPDLASGRSFATVGISHLTTSRRHLARPVLSARATPEGFVLDGFSPWVTGGVHAQTIVTGATMEDGRQILVALPTDTAGIEAAGPARLVGLSASYTGEVRLQNVHVPRALLLAGPVENVMSTGLGARTGGLETSTLAVGLATAAIGHLAQQAVERPDLKEPAAGLQRERDQLETDLLTMSGGTQVCSAEEIRTRANSLVLRATQAALMAAKGTGYVAGHPTGRWCREALFFLVWSCPQGVLAANLCEWASVG
jgi:alkylation response protein AidB-like acyl-CoA dehydrogenase